MEEWAWGGGRHPWQPARPRHGGGPRVPGVPALAPGPSCHLRLGALHLAAAGQLWGAGDFSSSPASPVPHEAFPTWITLGQLSSNCVHKGSSKNDFCGQIDLGHSGKFSSFLLRNSIAFHMLTCTAPLEGSLGMDFPNLRDHRTLFERNDDTPPWSLCRGHTVWEQHPGILL